MWLCAGSHECVNIVRHAQSLTLFLAAYCKLVLFVFVIHIPTYETNRPTHQFELHDAYAVPENVSRSPQQLCEGIQSVVLERRASHLEKGTQYGSTAQ